jgi:hypothetical protein
MTIRCSCGYNADSSEDLGDHLGEVFIPGNDASPDGQAHAEVTRDGDADVPSGKCCACGFAAPDATTLDEHILAALTPDDRIGLDGRRHSAELPRQPSLSAVRFGTRRGGAGWNGSRLAAWPRQCGR